VQQAQPSERRSESPRNVEKKESGNSRRR
jgi:hypothetical protein